jgi:hypothetical protein
LFDSGSVLTGPVIRDNVNERARSWDLGALETGLALNDEGEEVLNSKFGGNEAIETEEVGWFMGKRATAGFSCFLSLRPKAPVNRLDTSSIVAARPTLLPSCLPFMEGLETSRTAGWEWELNPCLANPQGV